jgi:two-component system, chemotaxis family, CheB/CheR fusion protein
MDNCASAAPVPTPSPPAHVLLVDDNQPLLEFLVLLLEGEGLRLTAVNSPLQAAMLARQTRFDLVISDVRMPHLSGPELLAEIRNTASNRQVPAILISGQASIELGDWLPDSSNTHYLRKPFGGNDLIALIHRTLQLPLESS